MSNILPVSFVPAALTSLMQRGVCRRLEPPLRAQPDAEAFVEDVLSTLDERERAVLRLRHLEGLTLLEVGQRTSRCTREGTRQQVLRALGRLRKRFGREAQAQLGGLSAALEASGGAVGVELVPALCGTGSLRHVLLCAAIAGDEALWLWSPRILTRRSRADLARGLGALRASVQATRLAWLPVSRLAAQVAEVADLALDRRTLEGLVEDAFGWTAQPGVAEDVVVVSRERGDRIATLLYEAGGPMGMDALCAQWRAQFAAFEDDTAAPGRRAYPHRLAHALRAAIDRRDDVWRTAHSTFCHVEHLDSRTHCASSTGDRPAITRAASRRRRDRLAERRDAVADV